MRPPTAGPGSPCRLLAVVSQLGHVLLLPAEPEARSEPVAVSGGVSGTELTQRSTCSCTPTRRGKESSHIYRVRQWVEQTGSCFGGRGGGGGGSRSSDEAPRGLPILFPGCVL